MIRLCGAVLAAVVVCGSAFAQGRLPSPALNNPTITGGTIAGAPISGSTGDFTTLSAAGAVSGAGITALLAPYAPLASPTFTGTTTLNGTVSGSGITTLLAPYAPLASPTFTGTMAGAAMAFTGNGTIGGTLGVTGNATVGGTLTPAGNLIGTARVGTTLAQLGTDLTNGNLRLGSTSVSTTPYVDFINANAVGMRFILNTPTTLTVQAGATTTVGVFNSTGFTTPTLGVTGSIGGSGNYVLSGTTSQSWLRGTSSLSGSLTSSASGLNQLNTPSDTADLTGTPFGYPSLSVNRNFGGTGAKGPRTGIMSVLSLTAPIVGDTSNQQYNALTSFFQAAANAGGTDLTIAGAAGVGYGVYPQALLNAGATNFIRVSGGEADIGIVPTTQTLVISGTVTSGDVITATFTSSSIVGSPVSVTYTVGTGNLYSHIANGLAAAIMANSAIYNAGVSARQTPTLNTSLDIVWPTQNSVTVAVTTPGTEILTLGSVVTGASARSKIGFTIARAPFDGAQGAAGGAQNVGIGISDNGAYAIGGWSYGIEFGNSVDRNGTIIGTAPLASTQTQAGSGRLGPLGPSMAFKGLDLSGYNFSQASGYSVVVPGMTVNGTGIVGIANATLTTTSTGLAIDVVGKVGSGNPTIVSGGGGGSGGLLNNYFVGDIVSGVNGTDINGGQYLVTAVNPSTGAVTALTTLVQPSTATASLGTAITTTGGSGTGMTITPTGVANAALSIMPTAGGKLAFNGATPIVKATPTGACAGNTGCQAIRDALGNLGIINTGSITN